MTAFKCVLFECEHDKVKPPSESKYEQEVQAALVHWSVEVLWSVSPVVPAGRSCQVDQVVKGWSDNTE